MFDPVNAYTSVIIVTRRLRRVGNIAQCVLTE
jgi:hypothetical protein